MSRSSFNSMTDLVWYIKQAGVDVDMFNGWRAETVFGVVALENNRILVNFQEVSKKQFDLMIAVAKKNMETVKAMKAEIDAHNAAASAVEEHALENTHASGT